MNKARILKSALVTASVAMTVCVGTSLYAAAPGVKERSEARRDRESVNVGTSRAAQRDHEQRMKSADDAANRYKSSTRDAAAKQRYQDDKKRGGW